MDAPRLTPVEMLSWRSSLRRTQFREARSSAWGRWDLLVLVLVVWYGMLLVSYWLGDWLLEMGIVARSCAVRVGKVEMWRSGSMAWHNTDAGGVIIVVSLWWRHYGTIMTQGWVAMQLAETARPIEQWLAPPCIIEHGAPSGTVGPLQQKWSW